MKILVLDDDYPSPDNLYGDVFAHVRIKEYLKYYSDILVASSFSKQKPDYTYEGVKVNCVGSIEKLVDLVNVYRPNIILIHFATYPIIKNVIFRFNVPYLIWVHGYEALAWYRRLFNFKLNVAFFQYIRNNLIQLYHFRKLVVRSNKRKDIHFVFVSKWMKMIAQTDCLVKVKNASIIPNPINNELFKFVKKSPAHRLRILMIRPFSSKKYATDIVAKTMMLLAEKTFFKDLHFSIYGKGSRDSLIFKRFGNFSNVTIRDKFLTQEDIKQQHDEHGLFFCLTRQDAQGVSMCEAMSSGLVPITSDNTAIPEFVTNRISGIVTNNKPRNVASEIEYIYHNPEKFLSLSQTASEKIVNKAGLKKVIAEEIKLIETILYSK